MYRAKQQFNGRTQKPTDALSKLILNNNSSESDKILKLLLHTSIAIIYLNAWFLFFKKFKYSYLMQNLTWNVLNVTWKIILFHINEKWLTHENVYKFICIDQSFIA